MKLLRRKFLSLAGAVAAAPALSRFASALDYPTRPITIIVPFPAGGPVDTLARLLSEPMRISLGQPLVVENVGGAGGSIAVARVARAEPDGYTMILGNWTSLVGTPAAYPVSFDVKNDFAPVALLASSPLMLVGRKSLPANNVQELIAWLKANPGKATAGTIGIGSPSQVGAIYFQKLTGTQIQLVPYRGAAPALTDLLKTRWPSAPDIPTIEEAGVPELALSFWQAFWVPKSTPEAVVAKLNAAAVAALADPGVRRRLDDLGQEIPPRAQQTPQALGAFHRSEIDKWWPIIKAAGIKPE
jgi:tripartite-type tricarboxylate transporter receptor subunit TctC